MVERPPAAALRAGLRSATAVIPGSMHVLLVDDEPLALSAYQRTLEPDFEVATATSGEAALEALRDRGPFAVVVADMNMPGLSGLEFLVAAGLRAPDTIRIMITGGENQQTAADAVNAGGVFRFLSKPCTLETLLHAVRDGAGQFAQHQREREILEQTFSGTVRILTEALAAAEPEAFALGQRLRDHARRTGEAMNFPFTWELETAAMLLRIGLVTLPDLTREKLRTGVPLASREADLVQRIPAMGADLLAPIARLGLVADFIRYQAKGYDGSGLPHDAVRGEEIPAGARVLRALADLQAGAGPDRPPAIALDRLLQNAECYDPAVLQCLRGLIATSTGTAARNALTVRELRSGMIVVVPVSARDGIPIVQEGAELTPVLLERLRNFTTLGEIEEPVYVRAADVAGITA